MRAAVALLTVFGRSRAPTAGAWAWFPVVGAAIGALLGGVWWAADEVFPPLVAATLVVVADLAVTGMLHVDGLADTADGLLCHADRSERLRIMRTADVGAFGVAVVAVMLLAEVAALGGQAVSVALLVALWCTARTTVVGGATFLRYVRPEGMATLMLTRPAPAWPLAALVPAGALAAGVDGWRGLAAVAGAVLAGAGVLALAHRRIGGFTGDVLGAAVVVGQVAGLVVGAARW
ncbi:MAG TPA: adenosylcobinamide-GDP ribazoletransferase [Acidimicrobiia bacterium]